MILPAPAIRRVLLTAFWKTCSQGSIAHGDSEQEGRSVLVQGGPSSRVPLPHSNAIRDTKGRCPSKQATTTSKLLTVPDTQSTFALRIRKRIDGGGNKRYTSESAPAKLGLD